MSTPRWCARLEPTATFVGEAKRTAGWPPTAASTFVNVSQAILGIQPEFTGLGIDPCIPENFGDFTLHRTFRGAEYEIKVENPNHVQKGIAKLIVDGKEIDGHIVPFEEGKKEYHVTAIMG